MLKGLFAGNSANELMKNVAYVICDAQNFPMYSRLLVIFYDKLCNKTYTI